MSALILLGTKVLAALGAWWIITLIWPLLALGGGVACFIWLSRHLRSTD